MDNAENFTIRIKLGTCQQCCMRDAKMQLPFQQAVVCEECHNNWVSEWNRYMLVGVQHRDYRWYHHQRVRSGQGKLF